MQEDLDARCSIRSTMRITFDEAMITNAGRMNVALIGTPLAGVRSGRLELPRSKRARSKDN